MATQKPISSKLGFTVVYDDGEVRILAGSVDPSAGAGIEAPEGSVFFRSAGAQSNIYQKKGAEDSAWEINSSGGAELPPGLLPPPAPALSSIDSGVLGVEANVSFGVSDNTAGAALVTTEAGGAALDINDLFEASGTRYGVFGTTTTLTGDLASDTTAPAGNNYPDNAFGPANKGDIILEVNGTEAHRVNLLTFGSGADLNANGSGFNLGALQQVTFDNGNPYPDYSYRIGSWIVDPADQRSGYNYVRVGVDEGSGAVWTNFIEWVQDADGNALATANAATSSVVGGVVSRMSGIAYYNTVGFQYDVDILNLVANTYDPDPDAIVVTCPNASAAIQLAIPNITTSVDVVQVSESLTVDEKVLGTDVTAFIDAFHPIKTELDDAGVASAGKMLTRGAIIPSTPVFISFEDETKRVLNRAAENYAVQADIVANPWDSSESIASGGTLGYADGLLQYDSSLRYPTQGLNAGDFRRSDEGNVAGPDVAPAGNPNLSGETGNRQAIYVIENNTGSVQNGLQLLFEGNSTGFTDVVSGPSGNDVVVEIKLPEGAIGASQTGWMDAYEDFFTGQYGDGDGIRNPSQGAGRALSAAWGITFGVQSIAAGEKILVSVTASDAWSGDITSLNATWV